MGDSRPLRKPLLVRRILETFMKNFELSRSAGLWDAIAREYSNYVEEHQQLSGFELREKYQTWASSAGPIRQEMVDFAELQHWDMAAVENLLVELQSSPRMFEKVKRVWSNSNLCRLERIMQFEEFAREMNIEKKTEVLRKRLPFRQQRDALLALPKYDGNLFEVFCQVKRIDLKLGPAWHEYVENVDLPIQYMVDAKPSQSPYKGLPPKQIFHGYVFRLGVSDENRLYMYFRNDLTALIKRNGGEVTYDTPEAGLKVSVTIWPISSYKDKKTKHQCHHTSIYKAIKEQEFDFSAHLKSKDGACIKPDFNRLPIPLSDSVKQSDVEPTQPSAPLLGKKPVKSLSTTTSKEPVAGCSRNVVINQTQKHEKAAKGTDGACIQPGSKPIQQMSQDQEPSKLTGDHDKMASSCNAAVNTVFEMGPGPSNAAVNQEPLVKEDKQAVSSPVISLPVLTTEQVNSSAQNTEPDLKKPVGNVITPDETLVGKRSRSPSDQVEMVEMPSKKKPASMPDTTPSAYDFQIFADQLNEEDTKGQEESSEDSSSETSEEEKDREIPGPGVVTFNNEPSFDPPTMNLDTFRQSFQQTNDVILYMALKWVSPMTKKRMDLIRLIFKNENELVRGPTIVSAKLKLERALKDVERIKLIASKSGFSDAALKAVLNLRSKK